MSHSYRWCGAWGEKEFIRERVEFAAVDADPFLVKEVGGVGSPSRS